MNSKLLNEKGLLNYISGSEYDISYEREREKVNDYIDNILKSLKANVEYRYFAFQTHGDNIEYCDGKRGEDFPLGKIFYHTDGLITDREDIALIIKFADCTPILLYDPIKKVQASLHSGWRGTVKRISEKAIDKMVKDFNCSRENIFAFIGPSIDMENYEVGPEVYEAFKDFKNRDKFFVPFKEKYKLSMIDANKDILLSCGIDENKMEISKISTYNSLSLNSARRQKENYKLNCILSIIKK
ncbi:peptidoglycan editing factor PgeF [Peptoniphilus catoniae]|uniref:peptidoglycan editing factor PgeF n=1 Tax=Peptoniphilus catoniae TaxID=1660341 RepID=UPI0010FF2A3D|nr:peptidoglycan editing factor PgeF [Peptoniphilus catoniae]